MLTRARGAVNADPDDEIDVDNATALRLIEGGFAEPTEEIETATIEPDETADVYTRRARGRRHAARE